jgi:hypothetical protein
VVTANTPTICQGGSTGVNLFANGASTYSWNTGATTGSITVTPSATTVYTVMGTSTLTGCSDTKTISVTVVICTGIAGNAGQINNLLLYPNPTSGEFTIELANGLNKTYEINDASGRLLMSGSSDNDRMAVNLNEYAKGVYYVKVKCENVVKVIRLIKD